MRMLLTGDEAIAKGAYDAGLKVAAAYPGTPSTEILENLGEYKDIVAQWSINEKVAVETACGAALGGVRALAAMKHVGLNVAADPFFTMSYIGVRGGLVIVSADDPGMHSSQNEQDNRHYGRAAKILLLEPSDSQEAYDLTKLGFELSERFDTPVLLRITTRIAHAMGIVETTGRTEVPDKPYQKDFVKQVMLPSNARIRHVFVEERTQKILDFLKTSDLNKIEWSDTEVGVVTNGVAYQYVKEVFPNASVLKYRCEWPFDASPAKELRDKVKKLIVVEEGDPYIEENLKAAGVAVDVGKGVVPILYELNPDILREKLLGVKPDVVEAEVKAPPRPPALCPGCGHRGVFHALRREKATVFGDIGCYTLAAIPPLSTMDSCICMGASVSASIGLAKAHKMAGRDEKKVSCIIGDSTFMHSGITGLIDAVYNNARFTTIILDNSITAMTGHQVNPGTGQTLQGQAAPKVDLFNLIKSCGVPEEHISVVEAYELKNLRDTLKKHWEIDGPSVIIAKSKCVIFARYSDKPYVGEPEMCKSCGSCVSLGCPAISYEGKKSRIDATLCVGCGVCAQVCAWNFLHRADEPYVAPEKPRQVP